MSTAPAEHESAAQAGNGAPGKKKTARRKTSHLKLVPETRELREKIRARSIRTAARLDKSRPLSKDEMEAVARMILDELQLSEGYVGWTMVSLASAFWHDQVAAVPYNRRLLLLPHCLKHAEGCPADYDEFGLDCKKCGACSIADFRVRAEELGYKVLVAEGSPIVMKIIVAGYIDAIVGVACLNVLEKAIDKILLAGVPSIAVSLLSSDCRNTSVDEDWVDEMINLEYQKPKTRTRSYIHLLRAASNICEPPELDRLAPRLRGTAVREGSGGKGAPTLDAIGGTEAIAYDFLAKGGKHSRPFITLAVYDALTEAKGTLSDGAEHIAAMPDAVKRAALSIETFHKASLVHDDIEDDDLYRYGDETLHRRHGLPTAINVGDYLIGLGYRLVSREAADLGAEPTSDILNALAEAHMKLCEGQGAELLWRDAKDKRLKPIDALKIYALKTAPAFEAALYAGARMAGPVDELKAPLSQFARHLGVAFQILNDLKDWRGDEDNKLMAGGDVVGGRPTVLWALALEALDDAKREELESLVGEATPSAEKLHRVNRLYTEADVFEKASRLIEKYRARAEAVADEVEPDELRRLLYYLVDTVLERVETAEPHVVMPTLPTDLPVIATG